METISKRIDAVTEIPAEYRNEICPAPKSVKIELTSKCNFHCGFCSHHLGQKQFADMDRDFYKRIIKDMRDSGVEELGLFYIGESFICDWLPEAVAQAKDVGFPYVFLTTNGSLATATRVREVMEAGLDSLKFSLNNADQWQFRQVTGMAPSMFETIKNNVKQAWHIRENGGFKTKLYASSIKYDGSQQSIMQAFVDEIKPYVDEHYWLPLLSFGDQATKSETKMGLKAVVGNPGRLETMRPPLPCWAVFREGHISHEGYLSACCFDSSNSWIMADLNKVGFMEGWNSEKFQALRKAHLSRNVRNTPCAGCIGQK